MSPTPANRRFVPIDEAARDAPSLARLAQLALESRERLKAVEFLIPPSLRSAVRAGSIEEADWCLVVDNNAAAAKLRQVLPALTAELQRRGTQVNSIRVKVQVASR